MGMSTLECENASRISMRYRNFGRVGGSTIVVKMLIAILTSLLAGVERQMESSGYTALNANLSTV